MNRISPRIAALTVKLGDARHGGKYFSPEEIGHLIRELRGIHDGAVALEDAGHSRPVPTPTRLPAPIRIGATPIGTIFFQPAGAQ